MFSTRQPVQKRPQTIVRKKMSRIHRATSKLNAFGKQKYNMPFPKMDRNEIILERKNDGHMFTFPFVTVDNSLHSCCTDLEEFCNEPQGNDIPDFFWTKSFRTLYHYRWNINWICQARVWHGQRHDGFWSILVRNYFKLNSTSCPLSKQKSILPQDLF